MISPRCSRSSAARPATARSPASRRALDLPVAAAAQYGGPSTDFLDLRPHEAFEERTKYLDEALHADARHERVSPPLLRLEHPQRHAARVPRAAARTIASSISGCGSGRALLWNRDWRRAGGRDRHQPVLRRTRRGARSTCCSAICAGCRSPTARSPRAYSLDVLEHLSPEALRGMLSEAARVLAPGGALFVYTHVRKNAPIAAGPALDQRARPAARAHGADRHAPGAAAQVGSPEPARRHPELEQRRAPTPASASRASATTRRSSAASSRTS